MSAASSSNLTSAKMNKAIVKDIASRNWPLYVGILLLWIVTLIVPLLTSGSAYSDVVDDPFAAGRHVLEFGTTFGLAFAAILCGIVAYRVYSYLNSSKSAIYFGMAPCKRSTIFLSAFVAGFLPIVGICAVVCVLLLLSIAAIPTLTAGAVLLFFVLMLLQSFIFFGIGVFVAQLVGSAVGFGLMYLAVNGVIVAIEELFRNMLGLILYGTIQNMTYFCWTSPALKMINSVCISGNGGLALSGWIWLVVYAAVSFLLIVAANALNNRRQMERAGEFVVLPKLRPFLKYLFAILCGLVLAGFMSVVCDFGDPWSTLSRSAGIAIQIASWVVGSFLGAVVAQMLLERNIRSGKSAVKGAAILAVVGALLIGALAADLPGIQHRVPDADQVEKVEVDNVSDNPTYLEEPENIQEIIRAHQAILDDFDANGAPDLNGSSDICTQPVSLVYTLSSGRQLIRSYQVPYGATASYEKEYAASAPIALIQHALNTKEARESRSYFLFDSEQVTVKSASITAWNYKKGMDIDVKLNPEETAAALAALKADLDLNRLDSVDVYGNAADEQIRTDSDRYYDITLQISYEMKAGIDTMDTWANYSFTQKTTPHLCKWFQGRYAENDPDLLAYDMNN